LTALDSNQSGKYMSEKNAKAAGYRAAKNGSDSRVRLIEFRLAND